MFAGKENRRKKNKIKIRKEIREKNLNFISKSKLLSLVLFYFSSTKQLNKKHHIHIFVSFILTFTAIKHLKITVKLTKDWDY